MNAKDKKEYLLTLTSIYESLLELCKSPDLDDLANDTVGPIYLETCIYGDGWPYTEELWEFYEGETVGLLATREMMAKATGEEVISDELYNYLEGQKTDYSNLIATLKNPDTEVGDPEFCLGNDDVFFGYGYIKKSLSEYRKVLHDLLDATANTKHETSAKQLIQSCYSLLSFSKDDIAIKRALRAALNLES